MSVLLLRSERLALWSALLVPWLFIWQGLDFTDQGYLLTGYRCFLHHPEATEDSGSQWLTNLIGALWDAAFGGLGVLGMRALWALCLSLGLLLAFRLASALTSPRVAGLAVLVASVFLSNRRETWFSYNTSSSLLFALSAVLVIRGVARRSFGWLFAGGACIGVLPFARIPNLLAIGLLAVPVFATLLEPDRRGRLLRELGVGLLGVAVGVAATLALVYALGDATLFFQGLRDLFAPSMRAAGYTPNALLAKFVTEQAQALLWGALVCGAGLGVSRALGRMPPAAGALLLAACVALAVFGLTRVTRADEPWSFVVPGTLYFVLGAATLGTWQRSFEQRVAAFAVLIILVIAPLGSNNGIKNAHMGLWLALPLGTALLASLEPRWLAGQGMKVALVAGLALLGEGVSQAATYTYRDAPRPRLWTAVQHPQLRGQFTTEARARVVSEVLVALERRVAPGDYLLAYEGTPLLQYLTQTRPYLNRPWVMDLEGGDVIARLAAAATSRTGCLPVAVLSLKSTRSPDWPLHARRLEMKEPQLGARAVLTAFLRAHGYQRKWSNGFFEIQEPPVAGPGSCR